MIEAFEYLEFDSPSGPVSMAIGKGHQAIQETAYGLYQFDRDKGEARVTEVKRYPAACVNPPEDIKSLEWIAQGFPGAEC